MGQEEGWNGVEVGQKWGGPGERGRGRTWHLGLILISGSGPSGFVLGPWSCAAPSSPIGAAVHYLEEGEFFTLSPNSAAAAAMSPRLDTGQGCSAYLFQPRVRIALSMNFSS